MTSGRYWRATHGRVGAAQLLGMVEVPCLRLDHMNEDGKRAYVIADNKLALNSGWDEDLLAAELGTLLSADPDLDVSLTGFSIPEIDNLMDAIAPEELNDPADELLPNYVSPRVKLGDVWQLGKRRFFYGDALDPPGGSSVTHLKTYRSVDMSATQSKSSIGNLP